MASFFLYIIKSSCCLALFYPGYKVLLSNETFFRFNRKVLLAGVLVCLLLPLVELKMDTTNPIQQPIQQLEEVIAVHMDWQPAAQTSGLNVKESDTGSSAIPWGNWLILLYFFGGGINLLLLTRSLIGLLLIIKSGRKIRQDGYTLVLLSKDIAAFNWGKYIILSRLDYQSNRDEILTHELVHLRKHHSWDLVFMEFILLFHWFNPASWLLKKELQDIHEYQADTGVLTHGIDAIKYQLLLVKKAVDASSYTFANSFNHSKIKKRITMMLRKKSNNWARLKLALLVPVGCVALSAFASYPVMTETILQTGEDVFLSKEAENSPSLQNYRKIRGVKCYFISLDYKAPDKVVKYKIAFLHMDSLEVMLNGYFKRDFKNHDGTFTVRVDKDVPTTYLQRVKEVIETAGFKYKFDPTVLPILDKEGVSPTIMGSVTFVYKDDTEKSFTVFEYHQLARNNLKQAIDEIYRDDIALVKVEMAGTEKLLDIVMNEIKKKIRYTVSYNVSRITVKEKVKLTVKQ